MWCVVCGVCSVCGVCVYVIFFLSTCTQAQEDDFPGWTISYCFLVKESLNSNAIKFSCLFLCTTEIYISLDFFCKTCVDSTLQ